MRWCYVGEAFVKGDWHRKTKFLWCWVRHRSR